MNETAAKPEGGGRSRKLPRRLIEEDSVTDLDFYRRWGADARRRRAKPIPVKSWRREEFGQAWLEGYRATPAPAPERRPPPPSGRRPGGELCL